MRKNPVISRIFIYLFAPILSTEAHGALKVSLVESPPSSDIVASYNEYDSGGNTSVCNDSYMEWKWSKDTPAPHGGYGYFAYEAPHAEIPYIKRNRDLGQSFTYNAAEPRWLKSITVRTGYGDNVVRANTYGQKIAIQIFEVSGTPLLNRNLSESGNTAFHGWPHGPYGTIPHERDDFYTGENYTSLLIARGGTFPTRTDFGIPPEATPDHPNLKGRLLCFDLAGERPVLLTPGRTYAYLIMLEDELPEHGFTLANKYYGNYLGGHGIRREGNGVFPPPGGNETLVQLDPNDPANAQVLAALLASARLPADMSARVAIAPGTNGYPDVCTHRDHCFWVQAVEQWGSNVDPIVCFVEPLDGATVSGSVPITVEARDPNAGAANGTGIASVELALRRSSTVLAIFRGTSPPFQWQLDTAQFSDGDYTLSATATSDSSGTAAISVRLANGLSADADSDSDGLPDWWEILNFGDTHTADPQGDPDGDRATNLEEFLAGTDPNNHSSRPNSSTDSGPSCAAGLGAVTLASLATVTAALLIKRRSRA